MQNYIDRIVRAAKLDINLYEEVDADKGAMGQAMGVVVLSSIAAGIGSIGTRGVKGIIVGAITALIAWYRPNIEGKEPDFILFSDNV